MAAELIETARRLMSVTESGEPISEAPIGNMRIGSRPAADSLQESRAGQLIDHLHQMRAGNPIQFRRFLDGDQPVVLRGGRGRSA
jgi:hypothetical protein